MFDIAVSGITHYPSTDEQRFRSCIRFLTLCREASIPTYVVDTSPDAKVRDGILNLVSGGFWLTKAQYHEQKSAALSLAMNAGARAIVITEMEKDGLVVDVPSICQPILSGTADLVIPKRSVLSWATYPTEIRATEGFALDQIEAIAGHRWDTMFGAFAVSYLAAKSFLTCQEPMWSWLHRPRFEMIKRSPERVAEIELDFPYPPQQRATEEGNLAFHLKRLDQLRFTFGPLVSVYSNK